MLKGDDDVEKVGDKLVEDANRLAEHATDEAAATASSGTRTIIIVALLGIVVAAGIAFWITRSVTRPVAAIAGRLTSLDERDLAGLEHGLSAVAEGDLTVEVESRAPRRSRSRARTSSAASSHHVQLDGREGPALDRGLQRDARAARRR